MFLLVVCSGRIYVGRFDLFCLCLHVCADRLCLRVCAGFDGIFVVVNGFVLVCMEYMLLLTGLCWF